ncbi:hypothetical protein DFJ74DRAFT_719372 [Hyaloraphidium curvatum]|nr:hypothetical protein DFJ74DRAFT_719372 [Hyaloraphidium curvatum]
METADKRVFEAFEQRFTNAEWLCLFPEGLKDPGPLDAPLPPDPAADLRMVSPVTRATLVRELRPESLPAAAAVAVQTALVPHSALLVPWILAGSAGIAVVTIAALFGNAVLGVFGTPQMAAGIAAVLFYAVLSGVAGSTTVLPTLLTRHAAPSQRPRDADASSHPYAPIARWLQLRRFADGTEPTRLLAHDPRDKLCPCPDPACAGGLPAAAGYWRTAEFVVRVLAVYALYFSLFYTAFVTLGGVIWHSWWGIAASTFALISTSGFAAFAIALRFGGNPPARRLLFRLRHRALVLCLRSMLDHYRLAPHDAGEKPPCDKSYLALHAALSVSWDDRTVPMTSAGFMAVYFAGAAVGGIINATAGSCVPVWCFLLLAQMLVAVTVDMVNAAATNEEISAAAELYLRAGAELQLLLPFHADPERTEMASRAAGLGMFANAGGRKPRLARGSRFRGRADGPGDGLHGVHRVVDAAQVGRGGRGDGYGVQGVMRVFPSKLSAGVRLRQLTNQPPLIALVPCPRGRPALPTNGSALLASLFTVMRGNAVGFGRAEPGWGGTFDSEGTGRDAAAGEASDLDTGGTPMSIVENYSPAAELPDPSSSAARGPDR